MPLVVLLICALIIVVCWVGWRWSQLHPATFGLTARPPWYASRGQAGLGVLALIAVAVVFLILSAIGTFAPRPVPPPDTLVVRIAAFTVDGDDQRTGVTVAAQLAEQLRSRSGATLDVVALKTPLASPEAAAALAAETGANVVLWGHVGQGVTADAVALTPELLWTANPQWAPGRWRGTDQFVLPRYYQLARAPLNGAVVLPPLLTSLAQLSAGELEGVAERLRQLRTDYGDTLSPELPAAVESSGRLVRGPLNRG